MEPSSRVNVAELFKSELARLPRNIAAELEDHLAEEISHHLASGKTLEQARAATMHTFGDVAGVAEDLCRVQQDVWWHQVRTPWPLRVLILGWIAFGLGCLSRICSEENPSYLTIGISLSYGLASSLVGLGLLRRREHLRRLAIGFSLLVGTALLAKSVLAPALLAWMPVTPWLLPVAGAAAWLSAWSLSRPSIRGCFV